MEHSDPGEWGSGKKLFFLPATKAATWLSGRVSGVLNHQECWTFSCNLSREEPDIKLLLL